VVVPSDKKSVYIAYTPGLERFTMKVVFIHRQQRQGAYSIEELFHTIASELGKQIEVVEYVAGSRSRLLIDA